MYVGTLGIPVALLQYLIVFKYSLQMKVINNYISVTSTELMFCQYDVVFEIVSSEYNFICCIIKCTQLAYTFAVHSVHLCFDYKWGTHVICRH